MSTLHFDDELLAAYTAHELSAAERAAFEEHLAQCSECSWALQQTHAVRERLRTLAIPTGEPERSMAADVLARLGMANFPNTRALDAPESTVRPVSAAPSVLGAESHPDLSCEPTNQPIGHGAAREAKLRRNRIMDLRTREMPEVPESPLPALAERSRGSRHPSTHLQRSRSFVAVAAVVALALVSAALFGMLGPRLSRGPASGGGYTKATASVPKPTATPVQIPGLVMDPQTGLPVDMKDTGFSQVRAFGPNDLWGLGYYWQTQRSKTNPLGVSYAFFGHFDGRRWSIWPVPFANIALNSFSMDSDTDGWAVGSLSAVDFAHGVLVHFAHGAVTIERVPGAGMLYSVQMLSATEGWALGNAPSDNTQPGGEGVNAVTLHYLRGSWSVVANTLYPEGAVALSMDSAADGWIVSGRGHLGYLVGGKWAQWPQAFAGEYLTSVASYAPNDAWAVGDTGGSPTSEPTPVVLHYDGHAWTHVAIPVLSQGAGAMLSQVVMTNFTDGWISGELLAPLSSTQPQGETAVLLHYDGSQWHSVAPPNGVAFTSISMSYSGDGWAMGWNPPSGSHTYLCHYQNGAWRVVTRFG